MAGTRLSCMVKVANRCRISPIPGMSGVNWPCTVATWSAQSSSSGETTRWSAETRSGKTPCGRVRDLGRPVGATGGFAVRESGTRQEKPLSTESRTGAEWVGRRTPRSSRV
ncbi:hypothetical protein GCM10017688_46440 [Streptomyces ramulosus]